MTTSICPHCKSNLDDGDVYEVLRADEDYAKYTDQEVEMAARCYGWTAHNRVRFSREMIIQPSVGRQYVICPDCGERLDD